MTDSQTDGRHQYRADVTYAILPMISVLSTLYINQSLDRNQENWRQ